MHNTQTSFSAPPGVQGLHLCLPYGSPARQGKGLVYEEEAWVEDVDKTNINILLSFNGLTHPTYTYCRPTACYVWQDASTLGQLLRQKKHITMRTRLEIEI